MTLPYFTDSEVAELCGTLKQTAARARYLRSLGLQVHERPGGGLVAWRPNQGPQQEHNAPQQPGASAVVVGLHTWAANRKQRTHGQKTQRR